MYLAAESIAFLKFVLIGTVVGTLALVYAMFQLVRWADRASDKRRALIESKPKPIPASVHKPSDERSERTEKAESRWEQLERRKGWTVATVAIIVFMFGAPALWTLGYAREPNSFELLGTIFAAILLALGIRALLRGRPPKP